MMAFWFYRLKTLRNISIHTHLESTALINATCLKVPSRNLSRVTSCLQKELILSSEPRSSYSSAPEKLEGFLSEKNWEKSWEEFCVLLKKKQETQLNVKQLTNLLQLATKQSSAESEILGEKVVQVMRELGIHCNNGREYSALILFFGKYGRFKELKLLLKEMKERNITKDIFVYNALIESFGRISSSQTYGLYQLLQQDSITPDIHTFESLIQVADSHQDTILLRKIYSEQKKYITNSDVFLNNLMMGVCLKWKDSELGLKIFKDMLQHPSSLDPSVVSSFLDMLLKQGEVEKGLSIYESMVQYKSLLKPQTLSVILDAFSKNKLHVQAIDIFNNMITHKLTPSPDVCGHFLQELCLFGDVQQVARIYATMQSKDIKLSNDTCQMIFKKCLTDPSRAEQHHEICQKMIRQGIKLDIQDVEEVISRCLKLSKFTQVIDLYDSIATQGIQLSLEIQQAVSNVRELHSVKNDKTVKEYRTLIITSSKKRDFKQGVRLYEEMVLRNVKPDQYIYTMAMNCYSHCGNGEKVLELWNIIKDLPLPQKARNISVSILLDSCGLNSSFNTLQAIWEALKTSKFPLDENNFTSYIEALCKHGKYSEARKVFESEIEEAGLDLSYKTYETVITQFKMSKHRHEFQKLFNFIQAKHPEYFTLTVNH